MRGPSFILTVGLLPLWWVTPWKPWTCDTQGVWKPHCLIERVEQLLWSVPLDVLLEETWDLKDWHVMAWDFKWKWQYVVYIPFIYIQSMCGCFSMCQSTLMSVGACSPFLLALICPFSLLHYIEICTDLHYPFIFQFYDLCMHNIIYYWFCNQLCLDGSARACFCELIRSFVLLI